MCIVLIHTFLTLVLLCSLMFIDFKDFVEHPEKTVRSVLEFLGLEQNLLQYQQLPPGMKVCFPDSALHLYMQLTLQPQANE